MNIDMNQFIETLQKSETIILSTSADDLVTSRPISPVTVNETLYIRTSLSSTKARQMTQNPNVSVCMGNYYFTGRASLSGHVMSEETSRIRDAYQKRYPDSFSSEDEFIQSDEVFFEIHIGKLHEWLYKDGIPIGLAEKIM